MTFQGLLDSLLSDTLQTSVPLFLPELALCGTIVLMLLVRVFNWRIDAFYLALVGSAVGLWLALSDLPTISGDQAAAPVEIFSGMVIFDSITVFMRTVLLGFAVLFILLTRLTGLSDREDGPDFFSLVLGATLGMCLMASANHLMMVFLAVEMASVPSYVLAGIIKGRPRASEAALKYSIFGAGAAGVMLYGISLLAGVLNSAHLPTMARQLAALDLGALIAAGEGTETIMVLVLGGLMVMVGLAFKLSAVPFHFWCPDVFEGASAEVNAFLSVASKAAALALLVRVAVGLGYASDRDYTEPVAVAAAGQSAAIDDRETPVQFTALQVDAAEPAADEPPAEEQIASEDDDSLVAALGPVRTFMALLVAVIAAITCTFGNLAAYGQENIKRMLAYSTIAHAGYMMMPVAAALVVAESNPALARDAIGAMVFYITLYVFMNLGAFAIVAFYRNVLRTEQISDYAGLIRTMPLTVICFAVILVSLIGLPPMAGFVGKFYIFLALVRAGGPLMITLLVIAGINTAISLVYYLRVIKVMTIDPEPDTRTPASMSFLPATYVVLVTLPVLVLGVWFNDVAELAQQAVRHLFA
ncbi:MAG: NADH-quinone oxidoreductase subunit N [Pirellulales bacterium]